MSYRFLAIIRKKENRVTAAFLHILNADGENLVRFIGEKLNIELPSSKIEIDSQQKEITSIPDGKLHCGFSFNIYLESKIEQNAINLDQYEEHKKKIITENDFLVYITPDLKRPFVLEEEIYWIDWKNLNKGLSDYRKREIIEEGELLYFLIDQFEILLLNFKLLSEDWCDKSNDQVLIVPNRWYPKAAIDFQRYFCQNERSFRPSSYFAFYVAQRIEYCFKIKEAPKDNQFLENDANLKQYLEGRNFQEKEWVKQKMKIFILGERIMLNHIIKNDKTDKNGKISAYTQNHTYTTIEQIKIARFTSEL